MKNSKWKWKKYGEKYKIQHPITTTPLFHWLWQWQENTWCKCKCTESHCCCYFPSFSSHLYRKFTSLLYVLGGTTVDAGGLHEFFMNYIEYKFLSIFLVVCSFFRPSPHRDRKHYTIAHSSRVRFAVIWNANTTSTSSLMQPKEGLFWMCAEWGGGQMWCADGRLWWKFQSEERTKSK